MWNIYETCLRVYDAKEKMQRYAKVNLKDKNYFQVTFYKKKKLLKNLNVSS